MHSGILSNDRILGFRHGKNMDHRMMYIYLLSDILLTSTEIKFYCSLSDVYNSEASKLRKLHVPCDILFLWNKDKMQRTNTGIML